MRQVSGDGDAGWLLSGMTLGLDEGLSDGAREAMRSAGLTHLTAVSGANIAILLVVVHWLGRMGRVPRMPRGVLCAVRAGGVRGDGRAASPACCGPRSWPDCRWWPDWWVAGARLPTCCRSVRVLLLLIDPWLAFSVGFILSVAATAGLIAADRPGTAGRDPGSADGDVAHPRGPRWCGRAAHGDRERDRDARWRWWHRSWGCCGLTLQWLVRAGAGRRPRPVDWVCARVLGVARWDALPHLSWLPGISALRWPRS